MIRKVALVQALREAFPSAFGGMYTAEEKGFKVIIAGAGNVGTHLAKLLSREKQDIILMDDDEEKLTPLSSNFDLLTVTASPSSISGLM